MPRAVRSELPPGAWIATSDDAIEERASISEITA
jgi:hypothetical protein